MNLKCKYTLVFPLQKLSILLVVAALAFGGARASAEPTHVVITVPAGRGPASP